MTTVSTPSALSKMEFGPTWLALPTLGDSLDPFDFYQRMAAYKRLIDDSDAEGIFGAENQLNFFWGYVVQLYWQWTTGRLTTPQTPPNRIDLDSMWGYGNYTLCIVPLVGAMRAGVTPQMQILPPDQAGQAEYISGGGKAGAFVIPQAMRGAVEAWERFFHQLKTLHAGDDLEPLRFTLWEVHGESLGASTDTYDRLASQYSKNEVDFFKGWIRMVDFLGSAAWRTDLEYMGANGRDVLPLRLLTDADIPGQTPDMTPAVNANVSSVIGLTRQSQWRFNVNLWLWKRAMRTRQARDEVLVMLDATFAPSPENAKERRKLLWYMLGL